MTKLPKVNESGFFEIRLESIGGLGANLAGKMLAESAVMGLGLNGISFSSYGSEKKGSPVKAHIRFTNPDRQIRDTTPVERPNVVGIFHEALLKTVNCLSGVYPDSVILVNTAKSPNEMKKKLNVQSGTVAVIDAITIALEEKTKVNTAMLGALFRVIDFLDPEAMRDVLSKTFGKKYPHLLEANLRTFNRGYEEVSLVTYDAPKGLPAKPFERKISAQGYATQPIGGAIINPGNSILKDLSGSRVGMLPAFEREKCIDCAACDTVCPDLCFVWEEREDKRGRQQMFLLGIDYQYCKGCMKCVEACPTAALTTIREEEGYADQHRKLHQFNRNQAVNG